jgi:hypothetical protein
MPREISEEQLRQLNPADVRWYAVEAGWKQLPTKNPDVILLNHPTRALRQILLPTNAVKNENVTLLYEAVRTLADDEHRSIREVVKDLFLPPADVMQLILQTRAADSGTLPVDEGLALLQSGRDMLLAAACSAAQPRAFFPRQSLGPAREFLRKCRMGQTEQGSYVATFIAPIPPDLSPSLFKDHVEETIADAPFERRVTLLLMQGGQIIRGAMDQGRPDLILRSVDKGVSANLCDAIVAVNPSDPQASLHIQMKWSRTRPRPPAAGPDRITFAQSEFSIIREAGRLLRERVEPRRESVEGRIIALQSEPATLLEPLRGLVTVRALIADRAARVRFLLEEVDFLRACEALRDRKRVAATGVLHRDAQAKLFELRQIQDFQILADRDP